MDPAVDADQPATTGAGSPAGPNALVCIGVRLHAQALAGKHDCVKAGGGRL